HQHVGRPCRLAVVEGRADAVTLGQLLRPLGTPARDDDLLTRAPAGADQAGDQRLGHLAAAEEGGPSLVGAVAHRDVLIRFDTKNHTFAGRSANRRVRYGYHSVPYGMYTRTGRSRPASCDWRSRRTPYTIWNSTRSQPPSTPSTWARTPSISAGSCVATSTG